MTIKMRKESLVNENARARQFCHAKASVFEESQFEYVQNHLRILSAFYGVLKPRDGVIPFLVWKCRRMLE